MVICHVTWHLKWDRKNNPMLRHFAGNSGLVYVHRFMLLKLYQMKTSKSK